MSGKRLRSKKRKKRSTLPFAVLRFAVLLLVLILAVTVVFLRVETILVSGNHHESAEEVRSAVLERAPGGSLILACLMNNGRGVPGLPFVDSLDVSVTDTGTLSVTVREKKAVGCFAAGDAFWYFDADGTLLFSQAVPEEKNEGHFIPMCEGIPLPKDKKSGAVKAPVSGMSLEIRKSFFEDIRAVQSWCGSEGVFADLISFDENENMTLVFGDLKVLMGSFDDISVKLAVLTGLMPDISARTGTLDLKNYDGTQKDIYFF